MKKIGFGSFVLLLLLELGIGISRAGQIVITFDGVPPQIQCGDTWTNQSVILSFNSTIDGEGNSAGYCSFETDPGYIWLYPSRLLLNFSLLSRPVVSVQASIQAYGNTGLFGYSGATRLDQSQTPIAGFYTVTFTNVYPDYCAISSSEGLVNGITINTEGPYQPELSIAQKNGLVTVSWPTNALGFVLETSGAPTSQAGWTPQTNNITLTGSNYVYAVGAPVGAAYFRLRK